VWACQLVVEKTVDVGERVLVLYRVFGRHLDSAQEVGSAVAWIWTVRDGKIARIKGYVNHAEALNAVGLAD
jgi:ketosteroid isomerase-like protein